MKVELFLTEKNVQIELWLENIEKNIEKYEQN